MLSPITISSLAATAAPHWSTPDGNPLSLLIQTARYAIPGPLQAYWNPFDGPALYAIADKLPRSLQRHAPSLLDAIVRHGEAAPSVILTGEPPVAVAEQFFSLAPDGREAFGDLIARLAARVAPASPQRAQWDQAGRDAFGSVAQCAFALNVVKVATLLAVARNDNAAVIEAGDIALARRIVGGG